VLLKKKRKEAWINLMKIISMKRRTLKRHKKTIRQLLIVTVEKQTLQNQPTKID
jgi:hypothetical protein